MSRCAPSGRLWVLGKYLQVSWKLELERSLHIHMVQSPLLLLRTELPVSVNPLWLQEVTDVSFGPDCLWPGWSKRSKRNISGGCYTIVRVPARSTSPRKVPNRFWLTMGTFHIQPFLRKWLWPTLPNMRANRIGDLGNLSFSFALV